MNKITTGIQITDHITANQAGYELLQKIKAQPKAPPQCSFIETKCVRPEYGHLCGGLTSDMLKSGQTKHIPTVPAWIVFTTKGRPFIAPQQLSLIDSPKLHYDHGKGGGGVKEKRQWDVAAYYCPIGREWAIKCAEKEKVHDIRIEEVKRKPKCKKKTKSTEYEFCRK